MAAELQGRAEAHDALGMMVSSIARMVQVFRYVRDKLRDDGCIWVNMGDSYAHNGACGGGSPDGARAARATDADKQRDMKYAVPPGLKPKDLCGIPWRVAFALQSHRNGGGGGCSRGCCLQRFKGIAQQVDHCDLDLGRVPQHRQAGFEALALQLDACGLEARACVEQGAAGHVGQVEAPLVGLHIAQQGAHLFNRRYDLIGVAGDRLEVLVQVGGQGSFLLVQQQFAVQ
jgi:hypothetical protein